MAGTGSQRPSDDSHTGVGVWAGDRLIVGGAVVGDEGRDGETVGVHHADGSPPFDVQWSDTGKVSLVFPGPDARVHHFPAQ
ncbi:DUF1918 domain-containing protein [Streptomyces clavifer]|uniref:DUF1918 domain-containing protein n=1 Tax=Streptomyces clavifer TaxID=68188 RepID=UPI0036666328